MKFSRFRSSDSKLWPFFLLILVPLLANAPILAGAVNCDPELFYSGLGFDLHRLISSGSACFVDPAVADLTQPLGYLSAQDWLHFHVPWWNPYSGIGMPLAAEVQNESFFLPFVLLLHFKSGWFVQRLLFQILSGLFTYVFLLDIGLAAIAATLGAALFSLNGTFFLTAGTVSAPDLFLPLLLIAIEHSHRAAAARRPSGWLLIPLAVAGSIYAGFPETAYFDGLLAGTWALLRLWQTPKAARFLLLGKLGAGAIIGLALTAPMTVPFLEYLKLGYIGPHYGYLAQLNLPAASAPLQMLPLFYGALAGSGGAPSLPADFGDMWARIGGWFGCAPVLLAFYALVAKAAQSSWSRAERYVLAGWALLWEARFFGAPGLAALINRLPAMLSTDEIRYAQLSVEFAVFALAAFGLDDLCKYGQASRFNLSVTLLAFLVCLLLSVLPAWPYLPAWFAANHELLGVALGYAACVAVMLALLLYTLRTGHGLWQTWALMVAGSICMFLLPQLNGLTSGQMDHKALAFLQAKTGTARYLSIGPLSSNSPAAVGIAGLDSLQLPEPENWEQFYAENLLPPAKDVAYGAPADDEVAAVLANTAAFKALGVRYIGIPPGQDPIASGQIVIFDPVKARPRSATPLDRYLTLNGWETLSGTITAPPHTGRPIYAVTMLVGTFFGRSTGLLNVTLCSGAACTSGQADLSAAQDDEGLTIPLNPPFVIGTGPGLTYKFHHGAGGPLAFWLAADTGHSMMISNGATITGAAPILGFVLSKPKPSAQPTLVFRSPAADIYELPNPAPYAQASLPGCNLFIRTRDSMTSDCPAPAILLRRELYYPGWQAKVNGRRVDVQAVGQVFQQIDLPAGPARIRFSYLPTHIVLSCWIAGLALLLWGLGGWVAVRSHSKMG